jgi:hypothetical protein
MATDKKTSQEATEQENQLAQQYCDLIETIKNNIENYLVVTDIGKEILQQRITFVNEYYKQLFNIQYSISQIDRNKKVRYKKKEESETQSYTIIAIDTQAQNWLNRLQHILNITTIKVSEFDVKASIKRDVLFAALSIIIGLILTLGFDQANDYDLENFRKQVINNQDTIKTQMNELIKTPVSDTICNNKK